MLYHTLKFIDIFQYSMHLYSIQSARSSSERDGVLNIDPRSRGGTDVDDHVHVDNSHRGRSGGRLYHHAWVRIVDRTPPRHGCSDESKIPPKNFSPHLVVQCGFLLRIRNAHVVVVLCQFPGDMVVRLVPSFDHHYHQRVGSGTCAPAL